MSIKYNIIAIPLTVVYLIYSLWYVIDIIKHKNTLINFIEKYKKIIIALSIIIFFISLIKNLNNPLLY